jgi:drug/metabolite transporter (DMT)-like permease
MQAMYAATARIGAAQTALVDTLEPVSAVILAAIFLGERLEPVQMLGGAIVLAGVVIAQTAPPGAHRGPIPAADSGDSGLRRGQSRR